jgi:hypothetical protein
MAFTTVNVTGTYVNEDQTPAAGTIQFQLTEPISNGGTTIWPVPVTVTLNASGGFSVPLAANTDAGTEPTGSQYVVIERVSSTSNREYMIVVPSGLGSTVTLASLMPGQPGFS